MKMHSTTYFRGFVSVLVFMAIVLASPCSFSQTNTNGGGILSRIFSSRTPADEKLNNAQQQEQSEQKRIQREEARKQREQQQAQRAQERAQKAKEQEQQKLQEQQRKLKEQAEEQARRQAQEKADEAAAQAAQQKRMEVEYQRKLAQQQERERKNQQTAERRRSRRNRGTEDLSAYVPHMLPMNMKMPSYIERCGNSFEFLIMDEVEAMSLEDERNLDFTPLPDGYDELDSALDPFKVPLADTRDTFKIDVHTFYTPTHGRVTSEFGFRRWRHHNGIDLKVQRGDTIYCAFDGVVRIRRYDRRGYGYFVVVRHTNGLETVYGHFSKFLVQLGDEVKAGSPIGLGGSTGRSTGPHLHLEFRYLGNPINPRDIVDFDSTYAIKNSTLVLTASNFKYKKELSKIKYWTVRKGDTLGRISKRTGVSISRLCKLNRISRKTVLRVGRRLRYN